MAVEFTNKKVQLSFEHSNEEIKVKGTVTIDAESSNVEEMRGTIYKVDGLNEYIGDFSLMSINIQTIANIKYRTKASQLVDEVLSDAMTQVSTLTA